MKEKRKFYQHSWFIMLLIFSPLFPIGLFLMWREKSMNIVFKIIFMAVYIFAIVYTIQTQNVLFTMQNDGQKVEEKAEEKTEKELSEQEQKDITTMVAFVAKNEDLLGEFYKSEKVKEFDKQKYDVVYKVHTSMGQFTFHLDNQRIKIVTNKDKKGIEGLLY